MESYEEHKEAAEAQRYKKPWVQSTELSDTIGDISSQKDAIIHSINKTITSFTVRNIADVQRMSMLTLISSVACGISPSTTTTTPNPCQTADKYRTADGSCNNLGDKSFGAAGIPMRRFVPPEYADGM